MCIAGKAAQAALLAGHAYRDEAVFREKTGLSHARMIEVEEDDLQVHVAWLEVRARSWLRCHWP